MKWRKKRKTKTAEHCIKVGLIDDKNTSLLKLNNIVPIFESNPTNLGVEFNVLEMEIQNTKILYQIWDYSHEKIKYEYTHNFLKNSIGGIIVIDLQDIDGLEKSKKLTSLFKSKSPEVILIIVGINNKGAEQVISSEEMKMQTKEIGGYYTEINIENSETWSSPFNILGNKILDKMGSGRLTKE